MRIAVFAAVAVLAAVANAETYHVKMRDGTLLHTDVGNRPLDPFEKRGAESHTAYRWISEYGKPFALTPLFDSPHGCLIDRSPYGAFGSELVAEFGLLSKLVVVRQDMRGTGKSPGNFTLWHNDANDGYDTMQWISEQRWSNGVIYEVGGSADGIATFVVVKDRPTWLKGQSIIWATSVGYTFAYPGGAYRKALAEKWLGGHFKKQADFLINELKQNEQPGTDWWKAIDLSNNYGSVNFRATMWAGWYDIFLNGNLNAFKGYQEESDPSVRGKMRLVIDPLGHCQDGSVYFKKHLIDGRAILPVLLMLDILRNSTDYAESVLNVTFYVMGPDNNLPNAKGNYWTTVRDFPDYIPTPMYFHNDFSLSSEVPVESGAAKSIIYDPRHPVPTIGGNNLEIACGPLDQRPAENHTDVISFTTPKLSAPIACTGPINVVLYVTSNCTDTDFTAKLTDVYPDGQSRLIQDGIVRMRWRSGVSPQPMVPGTVYEITISLWNTSYVFNAEHQIRVSISSSNFPRFSANLNNGLPLVDEAKGPMNIANNTFFISSEYPSHLILPVVEFSQIPEFSIHSVGPKDENDARAAEILMKLVTNGQVQ